VPKAPRGHIYAVYGPSPKKMVKVEFLGVRHYEALNHFTHDIYDLGTSMKAKNHIWLYFQDEDEPMVPVTIKDLVDMNIIDDFGKLSFNTPGSDEMAALKIANQAKLAKCNIVIK